MKKEGEDDVKDKVEKEAAGRQQKSHQDRRAKMQLEEEKKAEEARKDARAQEAEKKAKRIKEREETREKGRQEGKVIWWQHSEISTLYAHHSDRAGKSRRTAPDGPVVAQEADP